MVLQVFLVMSEREASMSYYNRDWRWFLLVADHSKLWTHLININIYRKDIASLISHRPHILLPHSVSPQFCIHFLISLTLIEVPFHGSDFAGETGFRRILGSANLDYDNFYNDVIIRLTLLILFCSILLSCSIIVKKRIAVAIINPTVIPTIMRGIQ